MALECKIIVDKEQLEEIVEDKFSHLVIDNATYLINWTDTYIEQHPELTDSEIELLWKYCDDSIQWIKINTGRG